MMKRFVRPLLLVLLVVSPSAAEKGSSLDAVASPAQSGSLGPTLTTVGDDVWLSWLEPDAEGDGVFSLRAARLETAESPVRWSRAGVVDHADDFWPNWADLSALAPGPAGSLLAHRLRTMGKGSYDYGIEVYRSANGEEWQSLGWLHDDGVPAEHGFVSWVPEGDATRAFWLDGREMPDDEPMTLRTALVTTDGIVGRELLDARVCECCATDAAATDAGPLVVYRDRSDEEIRDIWFVRRGEDGWSEARPVAVDGWEIAGCPVNGPAVAAEGDRVWVAWFTAANGEPRVRLARSLDAAATFQDPVTVDDRRPLGRVEVVAGAENDAWVLWIRRVEGGAELRMARVGPEGDLEPARTLMEISPSRRSGFPRAARIGDMLILAWTEVAEGQTRVRTGSVELY